MVSFSTCPPFPPLPPPQKTAFLLGPPVINTHGPPVIEVVGGSRAGWGTVTRRAVVYGEIERSKVGLKFPLTYTPACDCACLKCSMRRQEHTSGVRVYVRCACACGCAGEHCLRSCAASGRLLLLPLAPRLRAMRALAHPLPHRMLLTLYSILHGCFRLRLSHLPSAWRVIGALGGVSNRKPVTRRMSQIYTTRRSTCAVVTEKPFVL